MVESVGENDRHLPSSTTSLLELLNHLQHRADDLLRELDIYQTILKSHNQENNVEIRVFKRGVESEVKALHAVQDFFQHESTSASENDNSLEKEDPLQAHVLKSSNLPFYESVWKAAKNCNSITAMSKKMYYNLDPNPKTPHPKNGTKNPLQADKKGVLVDIVADNGLQWVKVSTMTEKRLLFEIAKEGWEQYADYSDESDDDLGPASDMPGQNTHQLELVRVAHDLQKASASARIHFRHPQVRFVLPNIRRGVSEDVDAFIADLVSTGASVECASDITKEPVKTIDSDSLSHLLPSDATKLTSSLNLDCTILLAIISDISHVEKRHISPASHSLHTTYHRAIMRQIESEVSEPMLPNEIYPLLASRTLHCTAHAAQRMREIVLCMGTTTERSRAEIVLGEGPYADHDPAQLRMALSRESTHAVPNDLVLPIKVVQVDVNDNCDPNLSSDILHLSFPAIIAQKSALKMKLSPINASVFLYGWMQQMTTVTSNRAVAMGFIKTINDVLDWHEHKHDVQDLEHPKTANRQCQRDGQLEKGEGDMFVGPEIYVCETARSLIGKAKPR
ncbi:hypothetical protein PV10_04169 [Exophiala mesophila]|uniref:DUF1308 domain-containing protein n=1 Tax=Exophiala mesophila TaxID=212818 RepID=A0A0D1WUH8_EXOME|nr:uncharacterized protein PV10_04169 [Exophiala mesophila]KIV92910.1 hypothetical protein PV10_04169 [Exophiala mesophila]